jgi:uncharacterized protein (TIGR03435 family)
MRWLSAVVIALVSAGAHVTGQSQSLTPAPAFEVASVKPMANSLPFRFAFRPGAQLSVVNVPLETLVLRAYGVPLHRTVGMPEWTRQERYEITAKGPAGSPDRPEHVLLMLQTLLRERFRLHTRLETREMDIYVLKSATAGGKLGPGARPSAIDCSEFVSGSTGTAVPGCQVTLSNNDVRSYRGRSMTKLARDLEGLVNRPIKDETGISGVFDVLLEVLDSTRPEPPSPGANASAEPGPPPLFTALREQLGLRLEGARGPVEVLVIESIERPQPD